MDRRAFIGATAAGIVAAPLAAIAQQAATVRRIGGLAIEPLPTQAELTAEAAPLRALGWVEGKNILRPDPLDLDGFCLFLDGG